MSATVYGMVGEFPHHERVLEAARRARAAGYDRIEAYAPFHVEGLAELTGERRTGVPSLTLLAAVAGGGAGYFLTWYSSVIHYPLNVGGRPLNSWPAFLPVTFDFTILCAALAAVLGMLFLNGLPRLHHPIFNTPHFTDRNASHCYLCIRAENIGYDRVATADFLRDAGADHVWEVPA